MSEIPAPKCSNPTCRVEETGVCQLDYDPTEACPNFSFEGPNLDDPIEEREDNGPNEEISRSGVDIASGDTLSELEVTRLMRRVTPSIVAIVGDQDCGKTTLIASLYERFQKGPFADYTFCGSQTLVAFDKRHYLARISSERPKPKTPRTSRNDPLGYFHLALRTRSSDGPVQHLLVSDRSGEVYQAARNDTNLIADLSEFRHSHRVAILLDGRRLANPVYRHGYRRRVRQMIQALSDNNALRDDTVIDLVTTKMDIVEVSEHKAEILSLLDGFEGQLKSEFGQRHGGIEFARISALPVARPEMGVVGLDDLLKRWIRQSSPLDLSLPPLDAPIREIDRLMKIWM